MAKNKNSLSQAIECERIGDSAEPLEAQSQNGSLVSKIEKTRSRQKSYVMDLRIHSPASLEQSGLGHLDAAPALVRLAKVKGIDVIAVTDFFSAEFVDRVVNAARDSEVTVVPGVVIRCCIAECRDVTIVCLFPENTNAARITDFLIELGVPRSSFGSRNFVITKPMEQVLQAVERYQGIAIPSRMDKTPHRTSVIPTLVEKYGFRAFDLAYADSTRIFRARWPKIKFKLFSFSNANVLSQVGSRTAKVKLDVPGFDGIRALVSREVGP